MGRMASGPCIVFRLMGLGALVTTFVSVAVEAQERQDSLANNQVKLQKSVQEKLGISFRGLVFECAPYCRYIGEQKDEGFSAIETSGQLEIANLKGVSVKDPLYPLLSEKGRGDNPKSSQSDGNDSLDGQKKLKDKEKPDSPPEVPPFARVPYDFGWAVSWVLDGGSQTITSDTQIQSAIAPQSPVIAQGLRLDLAKGKPWHFFGQWLRPMFSYRLRQSYQYKTKQDNLAMSFNETEMLVGLWVLKQSVQAGLSYLMKMHKTNVPQDDLTHYSSSRNDQWIRISMRYQKRWEFDFDHLLSSVMNDSQDFRSSPFKVSAFSIGGRYCSKTYDVFDYRVGYCGGVSQMSEKQNAAINPMFLSGGTSEMIRSEFGVSLSLRFGEDLYQ